MAETATSDVEPWLRPWLDAQEHWWKYWSELYGYGTADAQRRPEDPERWGSALIDWYRDWTFPKLQRHSESAQAGAWRDWAGLGRQFQEQIWQNVFSMAGGARQGSERLSESGEVKDILGGLATFWGMPLDNWRRVCSAFSTLPGDMEGAVRGSGSPYGPESVHQTLLGFLSMPTLGYTREWQEEWQRWAISNLEYGRALQGFMAVLVEINLKAIDLFANRLLDSWRRGEAVDDLKALYDLWIDAAEEAYGEISLSEEFVHAQSQFTNAVMALKNQEQKMVDEGLSALSMPTRRELHTSHHRVHQLQRRVWNLEQACLEADPLVLRETLEALKRDVESLRAKIGSTPEAAPPGKPGDRGKKSD